LLLGTEFDELKDDIREHGLHEILDGRNRYRACEAAGIEPTFAAYTGDEAEAWINSPARH
jgi:ParB-like chromosome segregation protein Spo0J